MNLNIFKRSKKAAIGGIIVTFIGLLGAFLYGEASGYKAEQLLKASLPNINTLCNTIILASATILALLFTVLGLSSGTEIKLKADFYYRIKQVAFFDTALFILTTIVFLILNFPISDSEEIPMLFYEISYYVTLIAAAIIGGMVVTVILLLYDTVTDLISIVGLDKDHPLAEVQEEVQEEEKKHQE